MIKISANLLNMLQKHAYLTRGGEEPAPSRPPLFSDAPIVSSANNGARTASQTYQPVSPRAPSAIRRPGGSAASAPAQPSRPAPRPAPQPAPVRSSAPVPAAPAPAAPAAPQGSEGSQTRGLLGDLRQIRADNAANAGRPAPAPRAPAGPRPPAAPAPAAAAGWSPPEGALTGKSPDGREFYIDPNTSRAVYRDGGTRAPRQVAQEQPRPSFNYVNPNSPEGRLAGLQAPQRERYINPNSPEGRLVRDNVLDADALRRGETRYRTDANSAGAINPDGSWTASGRAARGAELREQFRREQDETYGRMLKDDMAYNPDNDPELWNHWREGGRPDGRLMDAPRNPLFR